MVKVAKLIVAVVLLIVLATRYYTRCMDRYINIDTLYFIFVL